MASLTSYEFYQDVIDADHREREHYKGLMHEYAEIAERKLGQYCEFVAYSYLDGIKTAKAVFEKFGLRAIHAYAIQSHLNDFIMEYDEVEKNDRDHD